MPFDEIEHHPYLGYLGDNANYGAYSAMIIGSFPVYAITESNPVGAAGHEIRMNWDQYARTQFFYGSNHNFFWDRFHQSHLGIPIPDYQVDSLSNLLAQNGFLISDCLLSACRNGYSSSDKDLIPIERNNELLDVLEETRNLSMNLFNRDFRIGFLFSPSPQGAINQGNVLEYTNYLQVNPGATYSEFVMVQWKQLLFHRSFEFNGTNAI